MAINSINSSGYNFGSLASIKKQAQIVADRVEAESKARKAEQEATGLMKNAKGDLVEISSIPEWEREELERRAIADSVSPKEALLAALATQPNAEEVEQNKALAAKATAMQNKMLSGNKLTGAEKSFLRENFPNLAAMADRMEEEARQLENSLKSSKSKEEANQIYMDAKMRLMNGIGKKDGSILFLMPAIDKAFSQYMKGSTVSKSRINIWV
ncbi:MAG: hypothetical protein ACOX4U_08055 [Anaerovoracaceae bacterium]|jgi:hypothetical protein